MLSVVSGIALTLTIAPLSAAPSRPVTAPEKNSLSVPTFNVSLP